MHLKGQVSWYHHLLHMRKQEPMKRSNGLPGEMQLNNDKEGPRSTVSWIRPGLMSSVWYLDGYTSLQLHSWKHRCTHKQELCFPSMLLGIGCVLHASFLGIKLSPGLCSEWPLSQRHLKLHYHNIFNLLITWTHFFWE